MHKKALKKAVSAIKNLPKNYDEVKRQRLAKTGVYIKLPQFYNLTNNPHLPTKTPKLFYITRIPARGGALLKSRSYWLPISLERFYSIKHLNIYRTLMQQFLNSIDKRTSLLLSAACGSPIYYIKYAFGI